MRSAIAPLYLFACLILGGSAQGALANAVLQLAGVAIIAWSAIDTPIEPPSKAASRLFLIVIAGIAVIALQAVPLPASLWEHGIRARILDGYRELGIFPSSVAPYASLGTMLCVIPPMAMFCAVLQLDAHRRVWLAIALAAGTVSGIVLGTLQVATPSATFSWYLYSATNRGLGVGFFANANHMATLLVITLPFLAALGIGASNHNVQRHSALLSVVGAAALLIIVGLALNGSLAGYALFIPVLAASLLIILPRRKARRRWIAAAAALSAVVAIGALATSSISAGRSGGASASLSSRQEILRTTGRAIGDFLPWGSGLGSFREIYRLYESPDRVTSEYVVHAHNDYAELVLELGVPGAILILLFLAWWVIAVRGAWTMGEADPFARAASIASAAILLHSLVDFPLRTAAISACFAMCLALLAERRAPTRKDTTDLRPTRHLVIG